MTRVFNEGAFMKVKLLISRAGIDFSQNAGQEITVSDEEGLRMVASGQAIAVGVKTERAVSKKTTQKTVKAEK